MMSVFFYFGCSYTLWNFSLMRSFFFLFDLLVFLHIHYLNMRVFCVFVYILINACICWCGEMVMFCSFPPRVDNIFGGVSFVVISGFASIGVDCCPHPVVGSSRSLGPHARTNSLRPKARR